MAEAHKKPSKKSTKKTTKTKSSVKILHDVTAPGKTPVSSTSRPVIVGHRTTIKQDPMVIKDTAEHMTEKDLQTQTEALLRPLVDNNFEHTATKAAKGKDIQPDNPEVTADADGNQDDDKNEPPFTLPIPEADETNDGDKAGAKETEVPTTDPQSETDNQSDTPGEVASTADKTVHDASKNASGTTKHQAPAVTKEKSDSNNAEEKLDADKPKADQSGTDESEKPNEKPQKKNDEDTSSDQHTAAVKSLTEEVVKKQADKQDQAEIDARQAHVQELVDSKKYFVPIGQASRRKSNRRAVLVLLLVIVLSVVGLNFAVDAELIEIGVDSYTNIL